MKTKKTTTKSAKLSMLIFMLHFAKINLLRTSKNILLGLFITLKVFSLFTMWAVPLIINCNTVYNTKFNMYYIIMSIIGVLLGILINGIHGDLHHALYLNSKNYKLSAYHMLLIKLYNIL